MNFLKIFGSVAGLAIWWVTVRALVTMKETWSNVVGILMFILGLSTIIFLIENS